MSVFSLLLYLGAYLGGEGLELGLEKGNSLLRGLSLRHKGLLLMAELIIIDLLLQQSFLQVCQLGLSCQFLALGFLSQSVFLLQLGFNLLGYFARGFHGDIELVEFGDTVVDSAIDFTLEFVELSVSFRDFIDLGLVFRDQSLLLRSDVFL